MKMNKGALAKLFLFCCISFAQHHLMDRGKKMVTVGDTKAFAQIAVQFSETGSLLNNKRAPALPFLMYAFSGFPKFNAMQSAEEKREYVVSRSINRYSFFIKIYSIISLFVFFTVLHFFFKVGFVPTFTVFLLVATSFVNLKNTLFLNWDSLYMLSLPFFLISALLFIKYEGNIFTTIFFFFSALILPLVISEGFIFVKFILLLMAVINIRAWKIIAFVLACASLVPFYYSIKNYQSHGPGMFTYSIAKSQLVGFLGSSNRMNEVPIQTKNIEKMREVIRVWNFSHKRYPYYWAEEEGKKPGEMFMIYQKAYRDTILQWIVTHPLQLVQKINSVATVWTSWFYAPQRGETSAFFTRKMAPVHKGFEIGLNYLPYIWLLLFGGVVWKKKLWKNLSLKRWRDPFSFSERVFLLLTGFVLLTLGRQLYFASIEETFLGLFERYNARTYVLLSGIFLFLFDGVWREVMKRFSKPLIQTNVTNH